MVSAALIIISLSTVGVFSLPTMVNEDKRQCWPGGDPINQPCLPDGAGCFYGAGPLCCNRGPSQGCFLWGTAYGYCNVPPPPPTSSEPVAITSTATSEAVGSTSEPVSPTSTEFLE
ncbi:unnamed protein product [Rhizoctonia solani]|uniref:CBM1 domain-containing protein n=1 Tax=Rhizoctonia solani TaxID=456999 RepID=A0A8H3BVR4_9AGAM|nr:unnamed protein product [Rhizoctonia solani]